jgi:hypothetical protein
MIHYLLSSQEVFPIWHMCLMYRCNITYMRPDTRSHPHACNGRRQTLAHKQWLYSARMAWGYSYSPVVHIVDSCIICGGPLSEGPLAPAYDKHGVVLCIKC